MTAERKPMLFCKQLLCLIALYWSNICFWISSFFSALGEEIHRNAACVKKSFIWPWKTTPLPLFLCVSLSWVLVCAQSPRWHRSSLRFHRRIRLLMSAYMVLSHVEAISRLMTTRADSSTKAYDLYPGHQFKNWLRVFVASLSPSCKIPVY
jgi:hypothetical protein